MIEEELTLQGKDASNTVGALGEIIAWEILGKKWEFRVTRSAYIKCLRLYILATQMRRSIEKRSQPVKIGGNHDRLIDCYVVVYKSINRNHF